MTTPARNNRPAAPPRVAPRNARANAPAPAADDIQSLTPDEDDDEDEDDDTDSESDGDETSGETSGEGKRRGGGGKYKGIATHLRKASVLRHNAARLHTVAHGTKDKKSKEMDGWAPNEDVKNALSQIDQATALLNAAATTLENLGPDFNPYPNRTRSVANADRGALAEGTKVRIRQKNQDSFKDLLSAEEMNNLVVKRQTGTKVLVITPDGGKMFLARGMIELLAATAPATDAA